MSKRIEQEEMLTKELDTLENAIGDENHALAGCAREEIWKIVYRIVDLAVAEERKRTIQVLEEKNENPTYYETIVRSDIWKEWTKYAEDNLLFDMPESIECGWLSDRHWETFIKWVKNNGTLDK